MIGGSASVFIPQFSGGNITSFEAGNGFSCKICHGFNTLEMLFLAVLVCPCSLPSAVLDETRYFFKPTRASREG